MSLLGIVPARTGSQGISHKNTRTLSGVTLAAIAARVGRASGCAIVVTSDASVEEQRMWGCEADHYLSVGAPLHQDDTPMLSVVQHALAQIPGPDEQIIVLLQPTQPFRTPEHVRRAIALLQETGADSVVSVVPLPLTHSPDLVCVMDSGIILPARKGWLYAYPVYEGYEETRSHLSEQPTRRQNADQVYRRDGTVYAFRRSTVTRFGNIYGTHVRPLILDPAETCELDTEQNWKDVERRWASRAQTHNM